MSLLQYKCPCCGGGIEFDSATQKMKCPYCDTEFETDTLKEYDADLKNDVTDDMQWQTEPEGVWQEGEADGICSYICNSCGGEIIGEATAAATSCPYCGNPVIITANLTGTLRPDWVIPFKLSKEQAKDALKRHLSGKRLLPKVFKDENHIDEIKGIYVPFWLFDADAEASVRYRATRVRAWRAGDYDYTETSFYSIYRGGTLGFERVPVDGSSKMPDDMMESIEPYDFSEAVDFQTAYLSGFLADKYDVDSASSQERANQRIKSSVDGVFMDTVNGYTSVTPVSSGIRFNNGKVKYALYPVWLLNTEWNGQKYTFAMNGQTGKFVGDLPVDKSAAAKWMCGITAAATALLYGGAWLLWLLGIL